MKKEMIYKREKEMPIPEEHLRPRLSWLRRMLEDPFMNGETGYALMQSKQPRPASIRIACALARELDR